MLRSWSHQLLLNAATALENAVRLSTHEQTAPDKHWQVFEKHASKLYGFGTGYGRVIRVACLAAGVREPAGDFAFLGSGSNYDPLESLGVHSVDDLNKYLVHYNQEPIGAYSLSFYSCFHKWLKKVTVKPVIKEQEPVTKKQRKK